ncbi:MAG: hypothetical protein AB1758_29180, partial [Candidatus Eremiobacterota bacterium]
MGEILLRLSLLAAVLVSPLWWFPWARTALVMVPAVLGMVVLLATLLNAQLQRVYRLRYLEGKADLALLHMIPLALIVPRNQYRVVRGEALLQAGRFQEVERWAQSSPAWLSHHLKALMARKRRDYSEVVRQYELLLSSKPPVDADGPTRADLAVVLAEHLPDRLQDARRHLAEARELLPQNPNAELRAKLTRVYDGFEGMLQIADGEFEQGHKVLTEMVQAIGTDDLLQLPLVALAERWLGVACLKMGRLSEARQHLQRSRSLTRL